MFLAWLTVSTIFAAAEQVRPLETMKKTLFLIFAAYAAMAAARPSSTRFEPVRDSGGCRYCAVYAHCLKVLKGRHLAEALRIIAAHRAVCTRQGNK